MRIRPIEPDNANRTDRAVVVVALVVHDDGLLDEVIDRFYGAVLVEEMKTVCDRSINSLSELL